MVTFNCDKCPDGLLEFDITDADSGDGVWFQSFEITELVSQSCRCQYTEGEMEKLEEAAIDAAHQQIADYQVDSLLHAHGL